MENGLLCDEVSKGDPDRADKPDNRDLAERWLKGMEKTVKQDNTLAEKYCGIIQYETKGYARKLYFTLL